MSPNARLNPSPHFDHVPCHESDPGDQLVGLRSSLHVHDLHQTTLHLYRKLSLRAIRSCYLIDLLSATDGIWTPVPHAENRYDARRRGSFMVVLGLRAKPETSTPRSSVSRFTPCDSATISSTEAQLLCGLRLEMKAEVVFPVDGPTAGDLRELLNILSQESPEYRLWGENCKWFCSIVQESLTHFYSGELRSGTLSHRDLGKRSRKHILDRLSVIARGH
ncbi:hypothetical protein BS47DRAFT_1388495 [Hydnum rufescens UP504]|uniref:Uncharacterized protein n=1 Tax=Hydnum rufescens UP504 TaxID=1448309 RepID=A0A9P6B7B7_9AGAM|nr:hypothetical protein BS47DRAFT_1388495 [Hydnum rufescens UP504]